MARRLSRELQPRVTSARDASARAQPSERIYTQPYSHQSVCVSAECDEIARRRCFGSVEFGLFKMRIDEWEMSANLGSDLNEKIFCCFQSNKPIMEKRRRARINQCLDELKALILEAMKKDVSWCLHLNFRFIYRTVYISFMDQSFEIYNEILVIRNIIIEWLTYDLKNIP